MRRKVHVSHLVRRLSIGHQESLRPEHIRILEDLASPHHIVDLRHDECVVGDGMTGDLRLETKLYIVELISSQQCFFSDYEQSRYLGEKSLS